MRVPACCLFYIIGKNKETEHIAFKKVYRLSTIGIIATPARINDIKKVTEKVNSLLKSIGNLNIDFAFLTIIFNNKLTHLSIIMDII